MKILDIQHIDTDFDEFAIAKRDIEETNKINKHQSLTEFIKTLEINKFVLMIDESTVIPFNYFVTNKDKYLFICGTSNSEINDTGCKIISQLLIDSKFNIYDNLIKYKPEDLLLSGKILPDFPFIIYNNAHWQIFLNS